MKNWGFVVIVLIAGIVGFGIAKNSEDNRGTLSINTSSEAEIAPDVVEITIAIKTSDKNSLQKAAKENKEKSDKIYTMLQNMINQQKGDYIKTANYDARPIYVYNHELKRQVMDKYEVSNQIIVHTKNIAQLGDIIDKSISLGATDVNDLNFAVSEYEAKCRELIDEAAVKAYKRAEVAAIASKTKIIGVQSINANCSENSPRPVPYRMMAKGMLMANATMDAAIPEAATPIQSGTLKIYANFNASYWLK